MKLRNLFFLLLVLCGLIAGVYWNKQRQPAELATEEFSPLDLAFEVPAVQGIRLGKGKEDILVELNKKEGQWKLSSFYDMKADASKIERFLSEVRKVKGEPRASDRSLFPDFGLTDEETLLVTLLDAQGRALLGLRLGTKTFESDSHFMRKEGADTVYLINVNLLDLMGMRGLKKEEKPEPSFWADLHYLSVKEEDIQKIEMTRYENGQPLVTAGAALQEDAAAPGKFVWSFTEKQRPFPIESEKVKRFLGSLSNMTAETVEDPKAKDHGLAHPFWQMKLTVKDPISGTKELTLKAASPDVKNGPVYLEVSGVPVVYNLNVYSFNNLNIDDSNFFASNLFGIEDGKMEKLVIHAEKQELSFDLKTQKDPELESYLNELKALAVSRLLFSPEEAGKIKEPAFYWIELKKEGETSSQFLDVGEIVSEEKIEYAARKRDQSLPFAIPEDSYKKFFYNLDRFAPKPSEPAPQSVPVETKTP